MSDTEASGSGKIETQIADNQVDNFDTLVIMSGEALDTGGPCWRICSLKSCEKYKKAIKSNRQISECSMNTMQFSFSVISSRCFNFLYIFSDRILSLCMYLCSWKFGAPVTKTVKVHRFFLKSLKYSF